MKNILILVFIIQALCAHAQYVITGVVVSMENNNPVEYASIGITNKPYGTVSNASGMFSILLNDKITDNDTLRFSSIGYQSEAFLISELKDRLKTGILVISLQKAVKQLREISVISKKAHRKIVGYDTNSKLFGLGFDASGVGSQAGVIIPVKQPSTNIENFSFFIIRNSFKHLVFRINLYELVNGAPGKNISPENMFITVENNQTGKMVFDLSKYNIYLDKDVLITLEWITAEPASNGSLSVGAALFGHTYIRQASQYLWVKKSAGLGFSVKIVY